MTIGSISDALARVSSIEQQLQQLQSGAAVPSELGAGGAVGGSAAVASTASALTQPSAFAAALAQATGDSAGAQPASDLVTGGASLGIATPAGAGAPEVSAGSRLTSGQQQFATTLSAATGLSPGVVSAWLLAEESGGAAEARQAQGNNDWLNIGYTDSGTYGAGDSVWSDPVTAADATASWLRGQDSIPGYGTASAGVQSILASVGQPPAAQIQTIQDSGWSSGGYPSLASLYAQTAG